ncbi:MAG: CarD family transcriptional regulator [Bacillota bacterium]|nr:CarD family transcriptional regulator [Bacillota bacterium]
MYKIGDKIVYPMHGAGIIEQIEKREILGKIKEYYILNVSCGDMGIMIPVDNCDKIGIRPIVSKERLAQIIAVLGQDSSEMSDNWNKRHRENMKQMKTGDIGAVAEIVRNLTRMDSIKKLSTGEKKMLTNARRILQSELMLIEEIDEEKAAGIIDKAIWS